MTTKRHALNVGDVLVSQWGYDQTNVTFYRVDKVSATQAVLTEVQSAITEVTGWLSERRIPTDQVATRRDWKADAATFVEVPNTIRRAVHEYSQGGPFVKVSDYEYAYLWEGQPMNATHTH